MPIFRPWSACICTTDSVTPVSAPFLFHGGRLIRWAPVHNLKERLKTATADDPILAVKIILRRSNKINLLLFLNCGYYHLCLPLRRSKCFRFTNNVHLCLSHNTPGCHFHPLYRFRLITADVLRVTHVITPIELFDRVLLLINFNAPAETEKNALGKHYAFITFFYNPNVVKLKKK